MSKVKYVKGPGFIYDLLFVFILYYNKELCFKKFINRDKGRQDVEFYKEVLNKFPPFPEELAPFFYMKENCNSLMTTHYFNEGLESFFDGHDVNYLYNKLCDVEEVRSSLIKFLLPSDSEDNSTVDTFILNKRLLKAEIPDNIKQWTLAILSNTGEYTKLLIDTLAKVEQAIGECHKQQYEIVVKLCDDFNVSELQATWQTTNREYDFDNKDIFLSVCVLARNIMRFNFIGDMTCFIAGVNGKDLLTHEYVGGERIDVSLFGKIISDGSRIKILQMLVDKGELSTGEIAVGLSTALPSAYYHLEMMLTAGMLITRNEGRAVYYRINQDYFRSASDAVTRLTTDGES